MTAAHLRGFSTLEEPAQVAEAAVRARTGYVGLTPLQVGLTPTDDPDLTRAAVHGPDGRESQVSLLRTTLQVQASCGRAPGPSPRWTVQP